MKGRELALGKLKALGVVFDEASLYDENLRYLPEEHKAVIIVSRQCEY